MQEDTAILANPNRQAVVRIAMNRTAGREPGAGVLDVVE
jgi:hypothetical protein